MIKENSMKLFSIALLLLFCCLSACVTTTTPRPEPTSRMPFPEEEYLILPKSGKVTVTGQAFLKTRGGDVKMAAGNEILLEPVTSYSKEWYEKYALTWGRISPPDERLWKYVRKQIADGSGRFSFKNVPAGEYFISTEVTWEAPAGYQSSLQRQGGIIIKRITIGTEDVEVIVTR